MLMARPEIHSPARPTCQVAAAARRDSQPRSPLPAAPSRNPGVAPLYTFRVRPRPRPTRLCA